MGSSPAEWNSYKLSSVFEWCYLLSLHLVIIRDPPGPEHRDTKKRCYLLREIPPTVETTWAANRGWFRPRGNPWNKIWPGLLWHCDQTSPMDLHGPPPGPYEVISYGMFRVKHDPKSSRMVCFASNTIQGHGVFCDEHYPTSSQMVCVASNTIQSRLRWYVLRQTLMENAPAECNSYEFSLRRKRPNHWWEVRLRNEIPTSFRQCLSDVIYYHYI